MSLDTTGTGFRHGPRPPARRGPRSADAEAFRYRHERLTYRDWDVLADRVAGALARNLTVAVATGVPFLGRMTTQRGVLYVTLEEERADVKRHLRSLGAARAATLHVHVGPTPQSDLIGWLRAAIWEHAANLVIIDTLGRFVCARDLNDYAVSSPTCRRASAT